MLLSTSEPRYVADQDPFILGPIETVFDNLVFGYKKLPEGDAMKDMEMRVYRIMDMLQFPQDVVDNLYKKGFVGTNGDKLSRYTALPCSISGSARAVSCAF